jgi:hypothetical protein
LKKAEESSAIKPGKYRTSFEHKGKNCVFYLVIPETKETIVDLGEVTCGADKSPE